MKGFEILQEENKHFKYDGCYYLELDLAVKLIIQEIKQGNNVTIKDVKGNNQTFYGIDIHKMHKIPKILNESIAHKLINECKGICYETYVISPTGKKTRHCFVIAKEKGQLEYQRILDIAEKAINFLWYKKGTFKNILVIPNTEFFLTHDHSIGTLSYTADEKYTYTSQYTKESVQDLIVEELSDMTENHTMWDLRAKKIDGDLARTLVLYVPK